MDKKDEETLSTVTENADVTENLAKEANETVGAPAVNEKVDPEASSPLEHDDEQTEKPPVEQTEIPKALQDYKEITLKEKEDERLRKEAERKAMTELITDHETFEGDLAPDGKSISYIKAVSVFQVLTAALTLVCFMLPQMRAMFNPSYSLPMVAVILFTLTVLIQDNDGTTVLASMMFSLMTSMYFAGQMIPYVRPKARVILENPRLLMFPGAITFLLALTSAAIIFRLMKNKDFYL